jgi:hypothetical protein
MNRNPKKRLGAGPSDSEEIKSHPWFADVNWDDVYNKYKSFNFGLNSSIGELSLLIFHPRIGIKV